MAELKEKRNENLKKANDILSQGLVANFQNTLADFEKSVKSAKAKIEDMIKGFSEKAKEEVVSSTEVVVEKAEKIEKVEKTEQVQTTKEAEKIESVKKEEKVEEPKPTSQEKPIVEEKKEEPISQKNKVEVKEEIKKPEAVAENKPAPRPSFIVRHEKSEAELKKERQNARSSGEKREFRPNNNNGEKREFRPNNNNGEKREFKPRNDFNKGERPNNGGFNKKPRETYVAPPVILNNNDNRANKKKQNNEKNYEEKRVVNKRSLIRNQVDIDDFDENKTGYRKFRPVKKAKEEQSQAIKIEKAVINKEIIPLKELSEKIGITAAEITKRLFKEGIMKTINDSVDFDTAAFIADDIGVELELKLDKTAEDVLSEHFGVEDVDDANMQVRPPVVTVMGHVDHGKTSILDRIRKTNVTAGEAGGITQHIGAYQVTVSGKAITFLDTPGHAAFTAMRARGAQTTDIAVLVVAADDGIMPQTIESISHAKAANVPIIVAINKIDKPEANIERIKTQLTDHGLLPEEWGGDTILCPVSAKTGDGFDNLLESINLVAEMKDLKANPNGKAKGVVIEAKLDNSKGPIATILVQNGTLKVADSIVVGTVTGKIRAMVDDKGRRVTTAGPSTPVSIMGLDEVPNSGDILYAVDEKLVKQVAEERKNREREKMINAGAKVTLDDVFNRISEGAMKGLNIIVKADVQGSVEAVKSSLEKLSNEEVKVNVIHGGAGAINESDIMLAESSKAIIIGFNVRPDSNAKQIAERSGVDIKLYRVIYEAIEDVEKALKGMLAPKFTETYMGKAEVREVFKISGVGQIAGSYVVEGKITRNGKLRIYRDDVLYAEGNVQQLKRFKDDVKEVAQGYECGISIEKYNDIKVGDFIECYVVEESKA